MLEALENDLVACNLKVREIWDTMMNIKWCLLEFIT